MPASGDQRRVAVDRVLCTGHGVCAQLLATVTLDEWGYPIVADDPTEPTAIKAAVTLCPARALYLR